MTTRTTSLRLLDRLQPPDSTCCECGAATEDSKPYCPEHVTAMPYVAQLLEILERQRGDSAA